MIRRVSLRSHDRECHGFFTVKVLRFAEGTAEVRAFLREIPGNQNDYFDSCAPNRMLLRFVCIPVCQRRHTVNFRTFMQGSAARCKGLL